MKVAVIGSGISGIAAADRLQHLVERVVLFEADGRLGGHTDTHSIMTGGRTHAVDSGFIVFNRENYPGFSSWLDKLNVATQATDMSFGVRNLQTGLEYGTRNVNALFCQRRNLLSPRFFGMLRDLRRFYREAAVFAGDEQLTLGELVRQQGYSRGFVDEHLVPMCGALWSLPGADVPDVSASHVIAFMAQHRMLQIQGRPQWRVVSGGSAQYLRAFRSQFDGDIRTGDPVLRVRRSDAQVHLATAAGEHSFDAVVFACHSDQALKLLDDPSPLEREILGAIEYQKNRVVVHSDPRVMPRARPAWSSWNALVGEGAAQSCQVTYWMNLLQGLPGPEQFFVTLNPREELSRVWSEREYSHPIFTKGARLAQRRRDEINGARNSFYCGAYWGWGFHEDGFASSAAVVEAMERSLDRAA